MPGSGRKRASPGPRNPWNAQLDAEEQDLPTQAGEVDSGLEDGHGGGDKGRDADTDLWIYKGAEPIGRKLREVVLSSNSQLLCVSPFPVAPEILRLLFDALGRSRRRVRVVLSETNRPDLAEISGLLSRNIRVQFHFPSRPLPKTRLAHTYVFPSDEEVFILNSFYRDGEFVSDKLQGLWVGDMDFVREQL